VALPGHWSRRWAREHGYRWAPEPPGPPYLPQQRVADLQAVLAESDEPAVLVAHSAGCLTVAFWARRHTGPVRAALLVTPPYVEQVPRQRLPFPAIVVASRDDPHAAFAEQQRLAEQWGAELFDAGHVGHLDSATGFGPWPQGEELLRAVLLGETLTTEGCSVCEDARMDEKITPILHTADAEASAAWYARLGFAKQWEHRFEPGFPLFVCVSRGPMQLYLSEHRDDARPGTLLYLHVDDVDAVAAEFGAAFEEAPWGREVHVNDPDGNRLRIGSARR
jgi:predicted alpha/beta hydrolase family esterase/catechol 2,3-dioxygenase-like lactoylglutathione lyase family enzyme